MKKLLYLALAAVYINCIETAVTEYSDDNQYSARSKSPRTPKDTTGRTAAETNKWNTLMNEAKNIAGGGLENVKKFYNDNRIEIFYLFFKDNNSVSASIGNSANMIHIMAMPSHEEKEFIEHGRMPALGRDRVPSVETLKERLKFITNDKRAGANALEDFLKEWGLLLYYMQNQDRYAAFLRGEENLPSEVTSEMLRISAAERSRWKQLIEEATEAANYGKDELKTFYEKHRAEICYLFHSANHQSSVSLGNKIDMIFIKYLPEGDNAFRTDGNIRNPDKLRDMMPSMTALKERLNFIRKDRRSDKKEKLRNFIEEWGTPLYWAQNPAQYGVFLQGDKETLPVITDDSLRRE